MFVANTVAAIIQSYWSALGYIYEWYGDTNYERLFYAITKIYKILLE